MVIPLSNQWDGAELVRKQVFTALADFPPDIRDAAVMTASELAENAIKYGGTEGESAHHAQLSLCADPSQVRIAVASRASGGVFSAVAHQIEELQRAESVESLYLARMQELMSAPPGEGARMGLLRVAYEGQFELGYSFHEPFLTITAKRAIS